MNTALGDAHELGQTGSRADEHGLEALLVEEVVDSDGTAHYHVGLNFNTQAADILHLVLHYLLLGQTELGDAILQHASGLVQHLEDGDVIAPASQVRGTGQTGRTAAHHCDLDAVGGSLVSETDSIVTAPVGHETLELADGHRLTLDSEDAGALALGLLGADTAADCGQGAVLRDDAGSLLDVSGRYL